MENVAALGQWILAPVVACGISCVYFLKTNELPFGYRLLASAHGTLLAILYVAALTVHVLGFSSRSFALPFWAAFVLPLASATLALLWVKGKGALHLLLLVGLVCAAWALFVGTMAVTGEWL